MDNSEPIDTPKKPKFWWWNGVKNVLLAIFVIEHIVVIALAGRVAAQYTELYPVSEFNALDKRAREFVPEKQDEIFNQFKVQAGAQLALNVVNIAMDKFEGDFTINEKQVNSLMMDLNVDRVKKKYVGFGENNSVYLWLFFEEIEAPIMVKATYKYTPGQKLEVNFDYLAFGQIPLPAKWLDQFEDSFKDMPTEIEKMLVKYEINLVSVTTKDQEITIKAEARNVKRFLENIKL